MRKKETKEAKAQMFIESTIENYSMKKETEDQHSVLTKDKAYVAAGKIVEHFKKLRGTKNSRFLEENFKKVWQEHDESNANFLTIESSV